MNGVWFYFVDSVSSWWMGCHSCTTLTLGYSSSRVYVVYYLFLCYSRFQVLGLVIDSWSNALLESVWKPCVKQPPEEGKQTHAAPSAIASICGDVSL